MTNLVALRFVKNPALQSAATGTYLFGEGPPLIDYGDGRGWQEMDRPQRPGFAHYDGRNLLRLKVPVLLEGLSQGGKSVQTMWDQLDWFKWINPDKGRETPPRITLSGPIPHSDLTWVLQGLEWGDDALTRDDVLIRQSATLTFMEYQAADIAIERDKSKKRKTVRSKRGDTLRKLAKRYLGDASKWPDLRKLNPKLRDPHAVIKTNTLIRLP
jgi:hypothetical protein